MVFYKGSIGSRVWGLKRGVDATLRGFHKGSRC